MDKEQLKNTLGKIRPAHELVEVTRVKMLDMQNVSTKRAKRMRTKRIMSTVAGCAAALLIVFGIMYSGIAGTDYVGSFDMTDDFSEISAFPRMMTSHEDKEIKTLSHESLEARTAISEFESYVFGEDFSYMILNAKVRDVSFYEAKDDTYEIVGFALIQIEIDSSIECEADFARIRSGDTVTAVIYLESAEDAALIPTEESECRFCLITGSDGDPTDENSIAIGLHDTWQVYSCYYIQEN